MRRQYRHINLLVVIALFSSHFELESGCTRVKLSMDLAALGGRARDGSGTAKPSYPVGVERLPRSSGCQ
jgi:hypothetical protein